MQMKKMVQKKKKCLSLMTFALAMLMVLFAIPAKAQDNVYMHNGSKTVGSGSVTFLDSGGESAPTPDYYWERWFQRNEEYTFTFNPAESGKKIKVTFETFTAYSDNGGTNHSIGSDWSLRLNTAELSIYDGAEVNENNLITTYTGNMKGSFSVIANGPMTFYFHSYSYREEGWQATVQCVDSYELQKPQISFEACSDNIVINANNKGAEIYYLLNQEPDPNDPLQGAELYEGPFSVDAGTTIYACAKLGNQNSTIASKAFTAADVTPTPGVPTISRSGNTITMTPAALPSNLNETYYVWYTDNGTEPSITNGQRYQNPIECTTPNVVFKAVTRALSCEDKMSSVVSLSFGNVEVPTPTIVFANDGKATISCSLSGAIIYYTIDGSDPSETNYVDYGPDQLITDAITPGTTVKAIAVYDADGYDDSGINTVIYVPSGGSDVYGTTVLLDDREDHSWSYYSMGGTDNPVHSLNPSDVKITYYGNGITMKNNNNYTSSTSSNDYETSTGVAVGVDDSANLFVYLKTLENADYDGTGDYPYTMIPNPFSKRPVYGSGDTRWRGFQGWRVKRLSSDLSISDGSNTYGVGAIIPAETEITFVTEKEYGNEADFEAVWARAYVNTSNSATGLNGGSYERNFIVGATPSALSVPVTYSRYYPDGTGGANTVNIGSFTCSADTKFEYMNLDGGTLTANNYDLIMGRGLTGTAARIRGIGGAANNGLDYMLRVESGTYTVFSFINDQGSGNVSGRYLVKSILGCDYDRAKKDNSKLSVSPTNQLFYSQNVTFGGSSNRDAKTLDLVVKSGSYQSSYWPANNNGNGDYQHSMYLGQNSAGNTYPGCRYAVIEGGELASILGGRGVGGTSTTYCAPDFVTFNLRIKGGLFHGSIGGGASDNPSIGSRRIVITGGKVQSWVAAGANGTGTTSGNSATNGDSYVYIGGNAVIGGDDARTVNGTQGGQVFGAGRGIVDNGVPRASSVNTSNVVIADNAEISNPSTTGVVGGNVYGGGFNGFVVNTSNVYILGGTVQRNVFGGSYGNGTAIPSSNVFVKGGNVNGSVYGGSNSTGTVGVHGTAGVNLATVNMSGGETTNVFGGGLGEDTNMDNGTIVNVSGGTINNNVYGGGERGEVVGDTHVNVSGGTMKNVYGAGKGTATFNAQVTGKTYVNISGGTIEKFDNGEGGCVYGGGEDGDVMGENAGGSSQAQTKNVVVTIYGNHNQNQNNRDRIEINPTGTNNATTTIRWPRNDNGPQSTTVLVPCDQTITVTYYRGSNGNAYNIAYDIKSEDGNTTYVDQQGRPANSSTNTFIVPSDPVPASEPEVVSYVTVSGGMVNGDVFGGGRQGLTGGSTQVDVEGGTIRGSVFGGAYGSSHVVYVAGMHTVNIMGGHIFCNVYGGSRNADDALVFENPSQTETSISSVVNISAGRIDEQVYAAGYFGETFGSVFVFVGKEAILTAPNRRPSFDDNNELKYKAGTLNLAYSVWAGSDFGVFTGQFEGPTITGYSDIYVDGEGYNTQTADESAPAYMNIKGSIMGSGTSCDAGTKGRGIYVLNYGHANGGSKADFNEPFSNATRTFFSIQRADTLVIDNSHINFTGQSKVNSLDATEKYSIYSFDKTVRMTGGSSIFLNAPVFQIIDFWSATVDDLYKGEDAEYAAIPYNGLGATGGPLDNKVRVNNGNYIEIYHDNMPYMDGDEIVSYAPGYGILHGFAHMMVGEGSNDNTCAYARPKQCTDTPIDNGLDNPFDGGWVSYNSDENTFSIGVYGSGSWTTIPGSGGSDQIPYENHTTNNRNGEQYFRIWRCGGMYSEREGVFNAHADGTESFSYIDVTIKLPAWRSSASYYKFQTNGTGANLNTTIDYGADVLTFATAIATETDDLNWVHFVENSGDHGAQLEGADSYAQGQINSNPNVNFGLVALAGSGMRLESPVSAQGGLIICPESDEYLASVDDDMAVVNSFTCDDNTVEPEVTFRLTFSNQISTNMTWDPMFITLVQCDAEGHEFDEVKIILTINTYTSIENKFITQAYAIMDGQHGASDTYTAKVIMPTYILKDYAAAHLSQFYLEDVEFTPNNEGEWVSRGSNYDFTHFAMQIQAARNEDNSDGWNGTIQPVFDPKPNEDGEPTEIPEGGYYLGMTSARTPFAFDFTLTYNGNNEGVPFTGSDDEAPLGVLKFMLKFNNYNGSASVDDFQPLIIEVEVIRRGVGRVFYLDGQNGSNANDALHPDKAALSLSTIFNRCGYLPGDIIYIVNEVDVNKNLEWSGVAYDGVTIYRYPGGHPLSLTQARDSDGHLLYYTDETQTSTTTEVTEYPVMVSGEIEGNPNNTAYTGTLVSVQGKGNMTLRDITLDGHMSNHTNPWTHEPNADAGVAAQSPMINIASGGTLTLTSGTTLQENNSASAGGAVAVNQNGTLKMNQDATITNNITSVNGGAVYMAGYMIVSDEVQIVGNYSGTSANNVCLIGARQVIQIGTANPNDEFGPLTLAQVEDSEGNPLYYTDETQTETTTEETDYPVMVYARIGVTKQLYGDVDGYTEIVYVDDDNNISWLETPYDYRPNYIIYHDGGMYQLEKYNDPQFLYWIGTWVTVQYWNPEYESQDAPGYNPNNFEQHLDNIDTPQELAWLISYVNGLNGAQPHPNAIATVTADIDMDASIWVPIGNSSVKYKGTFDGKGHVISGLHSLLVNDDAAMFGVTEGATIQNTVAVVEFNGNSINKGTFIGTMIGGTLANVEAAGDLIGKANTVNMGGLVGLATTSETITAQPTIHSGFSVNTLIAENAETVVGGLVGNNGGNLFNSYANVAMGEGNVATVLGGLVGINQENCIVENCYVIEPIGPAFAYNNMGTINYCYAATGVTNYVGSGSTGTLLGQSNYGAVLDRKAIGYLYDDNKVTKVSNNPYISETLTYKNIGGGGANNTTEATRHRVIDKWPGLLSTLNQWVEDRNATTDQSSVYFGKNFTDWSRTSSSYLEEGSVNAYINGDLPVLDFPMDNCFATLDGKYLQYSATEYDENLANDDNNGIDALLAIYNAKAETSYIYLYNNATDVADYPKDNVNVFINEKAVLIQHYEEGNEGGNEGGKEGEEDENIANFKAVVGVTFENSEGTAGNTATPNCAPQVHYTDDPLDLLYDWHMMSSPLKDAPMGTVYDMEADMGFYEPANISSMVDNYLPNGLSMTTPALEGEVKWDLYSFYEPHYHWINLKRSTDNHWHYDINNTAPCDHDPIPYPNEEVFEPAKGYMMAISTESYLSSTGKLNNGKVTIPLTHQSLLTDIEEYGCNLIGNPFHAYLDMDKFLAKNQGFNDYYVYSAEWNHYVPNNGDASDNPAVPSRVLAPFQAFFVKVAADGEAVFNNGMTTTKPAAYSHFREEHLNYPLVNLFVTDTNGMRDLTVIEFNRPEEGGTDKLRVMDASNFELYARYNDKDYSILFTKEGTQRVPVWFKTSESGVYTMTWETYHGNFSSLRLVDNLTGVNYDMLSNNSYTFEASASDYASRFYITFACTGVDEEEVVESEGNFAFFNGSEWVINGKGQLEVIDMLGRILYAERLTNDQNRVHLDFAPGVYMIRVVDNKNMKTQKVIVR